MGYLQPSAFSPRRAGRAGVAGGDATQRARRRLWRDDERQHSELAGRQERIVTTVEARRGLVKVKLSCIGRLSEPPTLQNLQTPVYPKLG